MNKSIVKVLLLIFVAAIVPTALLAYNNQNGQIMADQQAYNYNYQTACITMTCSQYGYECGQYSDNCGGTIYCGSCAANSTCSAGHCAWNGYNNCQPRTCSQLGMQCGTVYDGCSGNIYCGSCADNQACQNGQCVYNGSNCQPRTCSQFGYQCGQYSDGCGNTINCGNCDNNQNYYGDITRKQIKVALYADPGTACAPVNGVNLRALVTNAAVSGYSGSAGYGELTYSFDCDNNGTYEKTINSDNTEIIAGNLCSYPNAGIYTARVRVDYRGQWATDTAIIKANNCGYPYLPSVIIQPNNIQPINILPMNNQTVSGLGLQKTVANLSNNSAYQTAVTASPSDIVSFKIIASSSSGYGNLTVSDIIPAGIINPRDLRVDGQPVNGSIVGGINIGSMYPNQQKVVTFTATIAAASNFPYGQSTLTDTAMVRNDSLSNSSTAVVYVSRQAVLGATSVSTGILDSDWMNYLLAGLIALAGAAWLFRENLKSLYLRLKSYRNSQTGNI